jgi:hypothetical protein
MNTGIRRAQLCDRANGALGAKLTGAGARSSRSAMAIRTPSSVRFVRPASRRCRCDSERT